MPVRLFLVAILMQTSAWAAIPRAQLQPLLEKSALAYFLENAHPSTGLVRDSASNFQSTPIDENRVASMAATGFGLAAIANAADRGWIQRDSAYDLVLKTLRFSRDHVARYRGWFLHFIDWETGERVWNSEYSTIDTALFEAGALYAATVFPDTEAARIAHQLYLDMDFVDMMTDGGSQPNKRTLSMAYTDFGYTPAQWNMYAEQRLLLILGLGHPERPLPAEAWLQWSRRTTNGLMGLDEALFVHQYSDLFIDFRQFQDPYPNYFRNGLEISRLHRQIGQTDSQYRSLREGFWGFSAGLAPNYEYRVFSAANHVGTVCIGCATASVMFLPEEMFADMGHWLDHPSRDNLWGRYGFVDSIDLDANWFAGSVLGITVGPTLLALANLDPRTSVWRRFMMIPEIQNGLRRASGAVPATFRR